MSNVPLPRLGARIVVAIGLAFVAAGAAWGIWRLTRPAPQPATSKSVMLLVSGDTGGWIVPCGCASNQSGGLPRRGTHLDNLRKQAAVLVVDVGGAPGGDSPYHRVKFEAILRGELAMGMAAHNLGGPEVALGADYLRELAARLKAPFISANVRDSKGELVAPGAHVQTIEGRRIAVVGVVSRKYSGPGLTVDDPREALLNIIPELKSFSDFVVVLAYAPEDELKQLAASLPEADAVIGGPTGQSLPPQMSGPTLVAAATNKGKFLIELDVPAARSRTAWKGRVVEMDPKFADQPAQTDNVQRYLDELKRRDFAAHETGFVALLPGSLPKDYRLAGTQACTSCHANDCSAWDRSKHAHAWDTLAGIGFQSDGYCQQCHTTGFGLPGGFESASRSLAQRNVGCESCHGPSQAHTIHPKTRTSFASRDQCSRCHDRENSPNFDYARYWPNIVHGAAMPKTGKETRP